MTRQHVLDRLAITEAQLRDAGDSIDWFARHDKLLVTDQDKRDKLHWAALMLKVAHDEFIEALENIGD